MAKDTSAQGMGRRDFFKVVGATALGLGLSGMSMSPGMVRPAKADGGSFDGCRVVVFGSDSLRIDYAQTLYNEGAPALSTLNPPICATCGGMSETQPGWASIWSALPSERIRCWDNGRFKRMPSGQHIMEKVIKAYEEKDLFAVWVVGKGNIVGVKQKPSGKLRKGSHYGVYELIVEQGKQGVYYGDESRDNATVYSLASNALTEAVTHQNFIAFVQFRDPDHTGHQLVNQGDPNDYQHYLEKAQEVDNHIADLIPLLPPDTDIVYCSDHGFDFKSQGDGRNAHSFSPHGMLATNFPMLPGVNNVSQLAIGRLIFKLAGGDPDRAQRSQSSPYYRLFGEDIIA